MVILLLYILLYDFRLYLFKGGVSTAHFLFTMLQVDTTKGLCISYHISMSVVWDNIIYWLE